MDSDETSSALWSSPGAGITGGYDGDSETLRTAIVFFTGLAMYNACELVIMIILTFKAFRGLYFWSMLIASIGIIPYELGFLLKFRNITTGDTQWLAVTLITLGWYPMITGQAVVLWSRLHLIVHGGKGERILTYTKAMIMINVIILHIPTTVMTYGSNGHVNTHTFELAYNIMEKIQMVGFFLQEVVLSSIYIVEAVKMLRTSLQPGTRKTMKQLVFINVIIISMDLGLLGLESASLYILQTIIKGVVYSIKLKLEFAILGKLVKFVGHTRTQQQHRSIGFITTDQTMSKEDREMNVHEFVDLSRISTDITNPGKLRRRASCPCTAMRSKGGSRAHTSNFDLHLARFEHVEHVSTLYEVSSSDSWTMA